MGHICWSGSGDHYLHALHRQWWVKHYKGTQSCIEWITPYVIWRLEERVLKKSPWGHMAEKNRLLDWRTSQKAPVEEGNDSKTAALLTIGRAESIFCVRRSNVRCGKTLSGLRVFPSIGGSNPEEKLARGHGRRGKRRAYQLSSFSLGGKSRLSARILGLKERYHVRSLASYLR